MQGHNGTGSNNNTGNTDETTRQSHMDRLDQAYGLGDILVKRMNEWRQIICDGLIYDAVAVANGLAKPPAVDVRAMETEMREGFKVALDTVTSILPAASAAILMNVVHGFRLALNRYKATRPEDFGQEHVASNNTANTSNNNNGDHGTSGNDGKREGER